MRTIQDDIDQQMKNKNPFHRFLLANRPYCELCSGPYPSTQIIEYKGRNTAVCDAHYRAHTPIESGLKRRAELEAQQRDTRRLKGQL